MKIRYRARALRDLEDIDRYLTARSPTGAHNVVRAIHAAIEQIAEHPRSSEQTSLADIRVKILGRYRYKIFYSLIGAEVIEISRP